VCLAITSGLLPAWGQTTGNISGTVSDQSDKAIVGAKVTLRDLERGAIMEARSNDAGTYQYSLLQPGRYAVTAESQGFGKVTVANVVLEVNSSVRQDIHMNLAGVDQQVTVQASAAHVDQETASLGETIQTRTITDLPLNGRNFLQLGQMTTGTLPPAVQNGESTTASFAGGRTNMTLSISGTREVSTAFLFDGIPSKHDYYGGVGSQPAIDGIEEFKIQRGYFSPQFGLGAIVNVVSRSGTNELHGSAWEFLRNNVLDARNFFDARRAPFRQNQYGVAAGTPVLKNRLFVFGDFERLSLRRTFSALAITPTAAMLSGNFSGLAPIYDPATFNPATGQRSPFPNNQIPADRISKFSSAFLQYIPVANTSGRVNLVKDTQRVGDDKKFDIRVDYLNSDRNKLFSRISYLDSDLLLTSVVPLGGNSVPLKSRNAVASYTRIFTANTVNELRLGLDRVFLFSNMPQDATSSSNRPQALGLQNLNEIADCNGLPSLTMSGYIADGSPGTCINTGNNNYHLQDNFSYVRGKHSITAGFELIFVHFKETSSLNHNGNFVFNGQFTNSGDPKAGAVSGGSSVADFLLGDPSVASGQKLKSPFYSTATWPSFYVNDDIKVNARLTMNLGVRYQYTQPVVEKYNRIARFNFATGKQMIAGQDGNPRSLLTLDKNDWAPRVGLAWLPTGSERWAVRSSYGIFYDRLPGNDRSWQMTTAPFQVGFSVVNDPVVPNINIGALFPVITPNLVGISLFNLDDRRSPYLQQWTLSSQHTISKDWFGEIAYVGSKGTKLSKRYDANVAQVPTAPGDTRTAQQRRPYPNYSFILNDTGNANSSYNALQLTLRKSFGQGLSVLGGYTWSRLMDNDSYDGKATRNYRPGDFDWGRAAFDVRQRLTASVVYDLPFGTTSKGFLRQVIGGWQVNGILSLQTGLPFHVTSSIDRSNTAVTFGSRPNRVCNGNLPASQQRPERWFDTTCFVLSAPNTYGNEGVHFLDTDGIQNIDISMFKTFRMGERIRLELRGEFFNALNIVNFGRPNSGLESAIFGRVTTALDPRIVQVAGKLVW